MKKDTLIDAVSSIDEELISEYYCTEKSLKAIRKRRAMLGRISAIAASLAVVLALYAVIAPMLGRDIVEMKDSLRPYKDIAVIAGELGYRAWPWEYKTEYERYISCEVGGVTFDGTGKEIGSDEIGEKIGKTEAYGYDDGGNGKEYKKQFDAYEIKGISSDRIFALDIDGSYYVFTSSKYDPPKTLSEVLRIYALKEKVQLSHYTEYKGDSREYYRIIDDSYIWDILEGNGDAPLSDAIGWHEKDRDYLSFSVTSNALGVYKKVIYITADGYFHTNVFNGEYLYYIGEKAAADIISYSEKNRNESIFLPYYNSIAGVITEINEDNIVINDYPLCLDPEDGMDFYIPIDGIRISRYVDAGIVKAGDLVQVSCEDAVDYESGILTGVRDISHAMLSNGDVLIPE